MFDQATQALDTAMQAGARLQGEAIRWWSGIFQGARALPGKQRPTQNLMTEIIPGAQKNVDQYRMLFDHSYHRSLDLLRRALEASQCQSYGEAQRRMLDLWQASIGNLQSSAQELTQINTRVMQTWSEAAERNAPVATETARPGAQAAASASAKSATRQTVGRARSKQRR